MSLQQRFKKFSPSLEKRLLTPKQSAVYLGVSMDRIYSMIRNRNFPYQILPGSSKRPKYLIDIHDLDRWIERRKIAAIESRKARKAQYGN